jgi:hypothetical protein
MCNGASALNTINSCNSGDCTGFIEANGQNGRVLISEPALWTENWMGWFASWGDNGPAGGWPTYDSTGQSRSKAAGLLRWFARGGSHVNQYNVRLTRTTLRPPAAPATATLTTLKPDPTRAPRP